MRLLPPTTERPRHYTVCCAQFVINLDEARLGKLLAWLISRARAALLDTGSDG